MLIEPFRMDIIQSELPAKEYSGQGQPFINEGIFYLNLTSRMIQSWTTPEGKVVDKEDYLKILTSEAPETFVEKLVEAAKTILAVTEEDRAFLSKLRPRASEASSSTA